MPEQLQKILALDDRLADLGFHPLTDFWREELIKFYMSGSKRWVAQVGRGGCKSTVLAKVALGEVLYGDFVVPPGERHVFIFVSALAEEAKSRLILIESMLSRLKIQHRRRGDLIELLDVPRGFLVQSATIGAVSGHRAIGFAADEVAKFRDKSSTNPAEEIAASAASMLITHPEAKMLFFSSPMTRRGYHFGLVDEGTTTDQLVSRAPSWVACPALSEEETHRRQPDRRIWAREFLGEPQDASMAAFNSHEVDAAMTPRSDLGRVLSRVCLVDASRGRGDAFAYAHAGWNVLENGKKLFVVDSVRAFEGKRTNLAGVVSSIAAECKRRGVRKAFGDQGGGALVTAEFRRHGIHYCEFGWSVQTKERAVETLRSLLRDELIVLPRDKKLRDEILAYEERETGSGHWVYGAPKGMHDDRASTLITGMHVEIKKKLRGSPNRPKDPPPRGGGRLEMAGPAESRMDALVRRLGGHVSTGGY